MTVPVPSRINLHRQSRVLEVEFDGGEHFELPCEYLRVYSPSAEVKVLQNQGRFVTGKEAVNISRIEPVGTYAIQIHFDDGHHTGVYSWETLMRLGREQQANWERYREFLARRPER
jgi:DUF971 family protein